jgi:pimeloyl-ACP methyl ester carboxylesterase
MRAVPSASPSPNRSADQPTRLRIRESGRGEPLVLLHGLASSSRYWDPLLATLGERYRVITPDLLGFGRSPKPFSAAYSVQEHVDALLTTLERRAAGPVTLVGHSMGSILALHLAVSRPDLVERLVLVSLPAVGNCAWGHHPDGGYRRFHHFSVHTTPGRVLFSAGQRAVQPAGSFLYPRIRRDLPRGAAEDSLRTSWTAYWRTLEEVVYGSRVEELFAAMRGPITVIHGARDIVVPVTTVRELAATRTDVNYIELNDAGHNPCISHPAVFLGALDPALRHQTDPLNIGRQPAYLTALRDGYTYLSRRAVRSRR